MDIFELSDQSNTELMAQIDNLFLQVYAHGRFTPMDVVKSQFTTQEILKKDGRILLASEGDSVIGVVVYVDQLSILKKDARENEVEFRLLAVDRNFRRKGIAKRLIEKCIELSRDSKAQKLVLSTQKVKMLAAQNLYSKMGFQRAPDRDRINEAGVEFLVYELPL